MKERHLALLISQLYFIAWMLSIDKGWVVGLGWVVWSALSIATIFSGRKQ